MKKETYCLACRKYTKNNNPQIVKNRQNRLMIGYIVQIVVVKNLDLLKNNKQWEYLVIWVLKLH